MWKRLRNLWDNLAGNSFASVYLFLSFFSLLINIAVQYRGQPVDFRCEAGRISVALLRGQGFANPFLAGETGPTAHVAPLYPYLHFLVCRVFGIGALGALAIIVWTSLAWSLHWTLVHRLAAGYGKPRSGTVAALIGVLIPLPGRLFKWDAVFTALILVACACMVAAVLRKQRNGWRHGLLLGLTAGIGSLLNPATLAVWLAWSGLMVWKIGMSESRRILLPAAGMFLLPVVIWGVRNYAALGFVGFIRDNAGLESAVSNNDCAPVYMAENLSSGCYAKIHPNVNIESVNEIRRIGEYRFNAAAGQQARAWMLSHPGRALRLAAGRMAAYWFPIELGDRRALLTGLIMCASTLGTLLSLQWRRNDGFALIAAGALAYSFVYYLVQFEQRYRYPMLWATILLACIGAECALARRPQAVTTSAKSG